MAEKQRSRHFCLLRQLSYYRGLYTGSTEERIDLAIFQLTGGFCIIQIYFINQLICQTICCQDLTGILLCSGFLFTYAYFLSLKVIY